MTDTIASSLTEIQHYLEDCFASKSVKEEIIEFYTELAASRGTSLPDIMAEVSLATQKILKATKIITQTTPKYRNLKPVQCFSEGFELLAKAIDKHWNILMPEVKQDFEEMVDELLDEFYSLESDLTSWKNPIFKVWLLLLSITNQPNAFTTYKKSIQRLVNSILKAAGKEQNNYDCSDMSRWPDKDLRAIAYSMDILAPGLYIWIGSVRIRIGGCEPDDTPYRYPGTIHSSGGIGLVLPGYKIFTTYHGGYDPRRTSDPGTSQA